MYRFKSTADADLLMLTPGAEQILRIVGKDPAPQGIIARAALPAAIAALETAIAAEMAERAPPPAHGGRRRDDHDDGAGGAAPIGLRQRAWPMLEMMRRSLAEGADIVWGV